MTDRLIKVATRSFSQHPTLRSELLQAFPAAEFNEDGKRYIGDELVAYLTGAAGAIISLEPITDDVLARCPDLRIVSKFGVGLDGIDQDACRNRQVSLGWTGGVNKRGVAEMALGFMLGMVHNIILTGNQLREGIWNKDGGRLMTERTVGIIGVGHVGKELVELLRPFNCRILVNDIVDQADYYRENGLVAVDKAQIFAESDFVTVHTPLSDDTRGMIGASVLAAMKESAYLINTARGGIVDQAALKVALADGEIAGAALDVFEEEPCDDLELLRLPNFYATPHIAGNAEESVLAMGRSAIKHLCNFFD